MNKPSLRKHLFMSTALVGAVLTLGYGRDARAQVAPPAAPCDTITGSGSTITCTGDVSSGVLVDNSTGGYTTLYVNTIDGDIAPAVGVRGIEFESPGDIIIVSDTTDNGSYSIVTTDAEGIFALSFGGTPGAVTVTNTGAISTTANGDADGIRGGSDAVTSGVGDATTGAVTITSDGDISTTGGSSRGILGLTSAWARGDGAGTSGSVMVTSTGDISTAGGDAAGIMGTTSARSDGAGAATSGAVTVTSTGAVSTVRIRANGIYGGSEAWARGAGAATSGAVTVTSSGEISTEGDGAAGIRGLADARAEGAGAATSGAVTVSSTGVISTEGDNAFGIYGRSLARADGVGAATSGAVTITNDGAVSTDGSGAHGIYGRSFARADGAGAADDSATTSGVTITSDGDITTAGDGAHGISAITGGATGLLTSGNTGGSIDITHQGGTIRTSGAGSDGIFASSDGMEDISVVSNGPVEADSVDSIGIHALNAFGTGGISIVATAAVSGGDLGIKALTGEGDAFLEIAGLISGGSGTAVDLTEIGGNVAGVSRVELQPGFGFAGLVDARNARTGNRLVFGGPSGEAMFDLSVISPDLSEEAGEVYFGFDNIFLKEDQSNFIFTGENQDDAAYDEALVTGSGLAVLNLDATLKMADGASAFTVASGGLGAIGTGGVLDGDVLVTAAGAVVLSNAAPFDAVSGLDGTGDVLRISGNYHSDGGALFLDTYLNDGSTQVTDKLVVDGDTSGSTIVYVANDGGPGGDTGTGPADGIMIVDVGGASDGLFALGAPVSIGAFDYSLNQADGQDWYLQASDLRDTGLTTPYIPYSLRGFGRQVNGTYFERTGNRAGWQRSAPEGGLSSISNADFVTVEPAAPASAPSPSSRGGVWARVIGGWSDADGSMSAAGVTTDVSYDESLWALQAGLDLVLTQGDSGRWVGSAFAHYGRISTDAANRTTGTSAGSVNTTGYGGGVSLTYEGDSGFYVDGVASFTRYDLDQVSGDGSSGGTNANGWALSSEIGKPLFLSSRFSVTPQAQLTWQIIDIDGFTDSSGVATAFSNGDSLEGRLGTTLDYLVTPRTRLYADAGIVHEFLDSPVATVAGTPLSLGLDNTGYVVGGGVEWTHYDRTIVLWAEGDYRAAFDGDSLDSWQATGGLKIGF